MVLKIESTRAACQNPRMTDGFLDDRTVQGLFDRAVAHFNARAYWEAHEDWETLWHEAENERRLWLQGMIQIAAALFHYERGRTERGFSKLIQGGWEKARPYEGDVHGIRFDAFLEEVRPWRVHGEAVGAGERTLREGAPPTLPRILYQEGVVPAPLPDDEES